MRVPRVSNWSTSTCVLGLHETDRRVARFWIHSPGHRKHRKAGTAPWSQGCPSSEVKEPVCLSASQGTFTLHTCLLAHVLRNMHISSGKALAAAINTWSQLRTTMQDRFRQLGDGCIICNLRLGLKLRSSYLRSVHLHQVHHHWCIHSCSRAGDLASSTKQLWTYIENRQHANIKAFRQTCSTECMLRSGALHLGYWLGLSSHRLVEASWQRGITWFDTVCANLA